MENRTPEWVKIGSWVKITEWAGVIVDICVSETRVMLYVDSPKCAANSPHPEWIEYIDGLVTLATPEQIEFNFQRYIRSIEYRMEKIMELERKWKDAKETE
jgi:hypothetical protein